MRTAIVAPNCGIPVARRHGSPTYMQGVIADSWSDTGVTLHATPRSSGTTPPVLTLAGTLTGGVVPYIQCDGAGARGVWTYKVSYDDGATFPYTGILSSGSATALPGIGSAITVAAATGNAATDNVWQSLATQVNDASGNSNHATRAAAANCPIQRAVAAGGKACLDYGVGTAFGLATPSVSLGAFSVLMLLKGNASSGYAFVQKNDSGTDDSYIFSTTGASSFINKAAGTSGRNVSSTWIRDSAWKTIARTFDGTHAGHRIYVNGALFNATGTVGTQDPGTVATVGALYIGSNSTPASSFRGLIAAWTVVNRAISAAEVASWHAYAKGRFQV